jgi:hypothetical protein
VRTATQAAVAKAQDAVFEENDHLVKAVMMIAVLDDRTTAFCRGIDGQVFPVDEGPRPPFHWRCRTTVVPVLTSWEELGLEKPTDRQRQVLTGETPERLTYADWLRRQTEEVQNRVLGPKRAEMYRSGRITIDKFLNNRGRVLTLEELRKRGF